MPAHAADDRMRMVHETELDHFQPRQPRRPLMLVPAPNYNSSPTNWVDVLVVVVSVVFVVAMCIYASNRRRRG